MQNFWEFDTWGGVALFGTLLISLVIANVLKRKTPFLRRSLIPTAVLGGLLLLILSTVYEAISGEVFFNTTYYGKAGLAQLETITYHALALGFIATAFKTPKREHGLRRGGEILNTGLTTVATYLLQGILGLGLTVLLALAIKDMFPAAGVLLPFGFGQGTGQALNYGSLYETDYGFVGGRSFGLSVAALGFLAASLGGVIHLNLLKARGKVLSGEEIAANLVSEEVQAEDEIPMNGSMDKLSVQFAFVFGAYMLVHAVLLVLGLLFPGMRSMLFGFNFLFGVLVATVFRFFFKFLRARGLMNHQYVNNFLMDRISGFCFDIMVVAGVAAIRIEVISSYWLPLLLLGILGTFSTYFYNRFVARRLFGDYAEEQFLMMFGMLTGTASTGVILLREIDPEYRTPAANNLVYQNFPAILFGFPIMFLAGYAPIAPTETLWILLAFFAVINLLLFRRAIFRRRKKR